MPRWLIGVDEAGYGPNLGPLTIGATVWRVDRSDGDTESDRDREIDLYDRLSGAVTQKPAPGRIAVADSKQLYKPGKGPGGGIEKLELGVLALLSVPVASLSELVGRLGADPDSRWSEVIWRKGFDPRLPLAAEADSIAEHAALLIKTCDEAGCHPITVAARMVFPAEFNEQVDRWQSKGAALSHTTLALVRSVIKNHVEQGAVLCICDKHGGRNRYGPLLESHFPEHPIETLLESRAESRYRSGSVEFVFRTKGESFLPTAWASMTAKLLRELSMQALNAFWTEQVPGLHPTAGYPVDAKRFQSQIAKKQAELKIDERTLWRFR